MLTATRKRKIEQQQAASGSPHLTVGYEDIQAGIGTVAQKKKRLLEAKVEDKKVRPKTTAGRARPGGVVYIGGERGREVQQAGEDAEPDAQVAAVESPDDPSVIKKRKDKGLLT